MRPQTARSPGWRQAAPSAPGGAPAWPCARPRSRSKAGRRGLAEHFRKKKLTKTNVKELLEGKETLVKGIKTKDRKSYNAVVKIGEKGYIDFIYV